MRTNGAAWLLLIAIGTGVAPDDAIARKAKPSHAAETTETAPNVPMAERATTGPLRAAYSAMSLSDRVSIQSDLIWTGDYNGVTDGEFSDRAIAAVKAFQKRSGGKDTGLLTADEREKLAAAAQPRVDQVGWRMLDDPATGARIGLPSKLVPQASAGQTGGHWQSPRGEMQVNTFRIAAKGKTLADALQEQKAGGRTVEYSVVKPEFFVISGTQGGVKKFYVRAHTNNDEIRGIVILYDRAMEGIVDRVVVAMSSAFTPFPTGEIAIEPRRSPLLRRKVEYGSGIVVSSSGHILTDRQLVDGCTVVTIAGIGNADRVGEDPASDLALLRVYGTQGLSPIAISAAGGDTDITIVGIADPQTQTGGSLVSTKRARVPAATAASRSIDPAPGLGFSGAAAIDGEGRLTGMVQMKSAAAAGPSASATQTVMVSADALRNFLLAQKVTPLAKSAANPQTSIVRVICVR
jgi:peptidoglycan hydrolase-like protein with peptidoglycan-binding domain